MAKKTRRKRTLSTRTGNTITAALMAASEAAPASAPEPDQATRKASLGLWLVTCLQRWFIAAGRLPRPEDWAGAEGWPAPELVDEVFGGWQGLLDAAGIAESQLIQTTGRLTEALQQVGAEMSESEAELQRRVRRLERRENELERRETRLRDQHAAVERQRDAARSRLEDERGVRRAAELAAERALGEARLAAEQRERAEVQARLAQLEPRSQRAGWQASLVVQAKPQQLLEEIGAWISGGRWQQQIAQGQELQLDDEQQQLSMVRSEEGWLLLWRQPLAGHQRSWVTSRIALRCQDESCEVRLDLATSSPIGSPPPALRPPGLMSRLRQALPIDPDGAPQQHWCVQRSEELHQLLGWVGGARQRPVLIVTSRAQASASLAELEALLAGVAHVVVLTSDGLADAWTELVGRDMGVWGRATRLYLPGWSRRDSSRRHRFFHQFHDAPELAGQVMQTLLPRASEAGGETEWLAEHERTLQQLEHAQQQLGEREEELDEAAAHAQALEELVQGLLEELGRPAPRLEPEQQPPVSVAEAVEQVELQHLHLAPAARQSASDSPFRRPQDIAEALLRLDALAGEYAAGAIGQSLARRALELGLDWRGGVSPTSRGKNPHAYRYLYEGQTLELGPHVVVGSGRGAGLCARIYLTDHPGDQHLERGLIVGHIGRHLPDTTTA